jgi:hypothetical protein
VTAETTTPWQGQPASLLLSLPPLAVVVLEPQAVDRSGVAT